MALSKLDRSCRIALTDCLAVKKKEKILIVTDELKREIGVALHDNACALGLQSYIIEMKSRAVNGEEPPQFISDLMKKFDVVLCPTDKSLTHTNARRNASALGIRFATFPGITKEVMIRGLSADYNEIARKSGILKKIFEKTKIVRLTSDNGTDVVMDISGRKAIASDGIYHKKGKGGNLPTGETFAAPNEGTSNGIFIVDGSMAGVGKLENEQIRMEIKNGFAVKISGGRKAEKLNKILKNYGRDARNIAEIGIGTNEKVKLSGMILEDEKVLGTAHIALGNNITMGGKVSVGIHLDGVIKKPTVYFDDKLILTKGKLLI